MVMAVTGDFKDLSCLSAHGLKSTNNSFNPVQLSIYADHCIVEETFRNTKWRLFFLPDDIYVE